MWRGWALACSLATVACGRVGFGDPDMPGGSASGSGTGSGSGSGSPAEQLGTVTALASVTTVEVGAQVQRLLSSGTVMYAATQRAGAGLVVYDISDPTAPVELGSAATAGIPNDMALVGTRLYVVSDTGGDDLEIFDVSTPATPLKLGGIAAADSAYRVAVQDDRAYVTSAALGDDLEIFDVSDPAAPQKLGGLDLLSSYYVRGVAAAYPLVYTAGQRMNVIDVSNPAAPAILGEGGFYWYAWDLAVQGTRVVGLDSNNGNAPQLRVWDASNPAAPTMVGMADIWDSYGRDVELVGPYAFTVCAPGGYASGAELEVWDVSQAGPPTLVTSAHLDSDGHAVEIAGKHVFVGRMQHSSKPELEVFAAQ